MPTDSAQDRILESFPFAAETIPNHAYGETNLRESELDNLWMDVKNILEESRDCSRFHQDENSWSANVVHPTLRCALMNSMLKVENVYVFNFFNLTFTHLAFSDNHRGSIPTFSLSHLRTIVFKRRLTTPSPSTGTPRMFPPSTTSSSMRGWVIHSVTPLMRTPNDSPCFLELR